VPGPRFGVLLPAGHAGEFSGNSAAEAWAQIREFSLLAEHLGYDSLWVGDHLLPVTPGAGGSGPLLEAWTTLAALGGVTGRCQLGVFVSNMAFRSPALLARMASTVSGIAGDGRFQLGIGAGWFEPEHQPLGFAFRPPAERIAHLERYAQAVLDAWTACSPRAAPGPGEPARSGTRPPVWIGGEGNVMLRRVVARYADWSCFGGSAEMWAQRRAHLVNALPVDSAQRTVRMSWNGSLLITDGQADLRREWARNSRDDEYESWIAGNLVGTWPEVRTKIRRLIKDGCEKFIVSPTDFPSSASLRELAANRNTL
jgi:alkanesulfonate monooxygenase SsuD/methylene tetrahydromethanopterin reductase-like flavin-dependent oxidoreductase (luciferase family)